MNDEIKEALAAIKKQEKVKESWAQSLAAAPEPDRVEPAPQSPLDIEVDAVPSPSASSASSPEAAARAPETPQPPSLAQPAAVVDTPPAGGDSFAETSEREAADAPEAAPAASSYTRVPVPDLPDNPLRYAGRAQVPFRTPDGRTHWRYAPSPSPSHSSPVREAAEGFAAGLVQEAQSSPELVREAAEGFAAGLAQEPQPQGLVARMRGAFENFGN